MSESEPVPCWAGSHASKRRARSNTKAAWKGTMRAELAGGGGGGGGTGEVGHQGDGGVCGQQHVSRPVAQREEKSDLGHPLRVRGESGTCLNTEPQAVENAKGWMPKHKTGTQVRACLATVRGGDDELHGAEEVHVPYTVEGDAGESVEVDLKRPHGLTQPQSLGLPRGLLGEGRK